MKNKIEKKKIIIIVTFLILALIAGTAYAVTWDGGYKVASASPSTEMVQRIKSAQKNGGKLEISDGEINSFIQSFITKSISKGNVTIEGVGVNLNNDRVIIKVPVEYKGISILLSCSTGMSLKDDKLILEPLSFKAGKFPVPASIVLGKISSKSKDGIKVNGNSIEMDSDILPFPVESFSINNSKLVMEIPSPAQLAIEYSAKANAAGVPAQTNGAAAAPSNNQGSKGTASTASKSQKGSTSNGKVIVSNPKVTSSLKNVSGGLSAVSSSVATSTEKEIIARIQSTVNKIITDPNYSYASDVSYVKSKYNSLPPESKSRVKSAIMNNMNVGEVMRLVFMFGV